MNAAMPESRERAIFLELVNRQKNRGPEGATNLAELAERCGVSLATLKAIENKGMLRDWPPLD